MRQSLKKLDFDFNDSDLGILVQLFASAQHQRLQANKTDTERVTRSTALVVLAQVAPYIEKRLGEAGLNWQLFRADIGLPEKIIPIETDDVDLDSYFEEALNLFAKKHPDRLRASPENFASAIVEMVMQDPDAGKLGKRLEASGVDLASLPTDFTKPEPKTDADAESSQLRRVAWICQFKTDERGGVLLQERGPGKKLDWQWATHAFRNTMQAGDPVVYLRQIGKGKDRGGIVGTGRVVSNEPVENSVPTDKGASRFVDGLATEIVETFVDNLIPRDEVFTDPPFPKNKVWRGAIVDLNEKQALRINEVLLEHQHQPLFDSTESRTHFIPDDAELDRDLLYRGPLAISLARFIHRIWMRSNYIFPASVSSGEKKPPKPPEPGAQPASHRNTKHRQRTSRAGFVLHLDAPWGGGKTTFANFIARVLNPLTLPVSKRSFLRNELGQDGSPAPIFLEDTGDPEKLVLWPEDARRPWIVVKFNAWQNEHVDPPWWIFYQAIRRQCFATLCREGCNAFCKQGDRRRPSMIARYGRAAVLWFQEIGWRLLSPKVRLLFLTSLLSGLLAYGFIKLGVIEPENGDNALKMILNSGTTVGAVIAALTGAVSFLWSLASVATEAILPGTASLDERLSLGSGDPFERFRRHFHTLSRRVRRPILIVIDDLDRCNPSFVVGLIRGIQTILRSPRVIYMILGDRDWIERAFESEHDEMSTIDVGVEQSFGARFVEKAIQISLQLPDISPSQKSNYVKSILTGEGSGLPVQVDDSGRDEKISRDAAAVERRAKEIVRGIEISDLVTAQPAVLERLKKEVDKDKESGGLGLDSSTLLEQIERAAASEVVKKAGSSEAVSRRIAHQLLPLANALPSNPRQVKRIINAITAYQLFASIPGAIRDESTGEPISLTHHRWRQLVLWIVLMTEWPRTWRLFAMYPFLAGLVHLEKEDWQKKSKEAEKILLENADTIIDHISKIRDDSRIMAILDNQDFDPDQPVQIDKKAVTWLRELTPVMGSHLN